MAEILSQNYAKGINFGSKLPQFRNHCTPYQLHTESHDSVMQQIMSVHHFAHQQVYSAVLQEVKDWMAACRCPGDAQVYLQCLSTLCGGFFYDQYLRLDFTLGRKSFWYTYSKSWKKFDLGCCRNKKNLLDKHDNRC